LPRPGDGPASPDDLVAGPQAVPLDQLLGDVDVAVRRQVAILRRRMKPAPPDVTSSTPAVSVLLTVVVLRKFGRGTCIDCMQ
jgi:hypothetical protein